MTKLACELEKECVLPLDLLKMKFESYQVGYLSTEVYLISLSTVLNRFTRACIKTLC